MLQAALSVLLQPLTQRILLACRFSEAALGNLQPRYSLLSSSHNILITSYIYNSHNVYIHCENCSWLSTKACCILGA